MSIKKAELHVHLEGTITPALARQLAARNGLTLPTGLIAEDNQRYLSKDFLDFLNVYDVLAAVIKTPQDYYDLTFDYLRNSALENTLYVEMMYSPDHAENSSGIPSNAHLAAIQQAIDDAKAEFGIVGRIIITAVRHYGVEAALRVAHLAARDRFACVTGFGLGGDEAKFPGKLFKIAYEIAAEAGLYCTVHAGEFAPASSVIEAIEHLPIQRIGHGVASIQSKEAMAMLKDKGIALELCPSSNLFLGLFKDMQAHPFPQYLEAGIQISINSDDPPFMSTTIGQEYRRVQEAYQYSNDTMHAITTMAIESAFVDKETKEALLAKI